MIYEISKRIKDGEWHVIAKRETEKTAFKQAVLESKRNNNEYDVRGFNKLGDLIYHSYFRDGKQTIDMSL